MDDPNLPVGDAGFFSRLSRLGRSGFMGGGDLPDLEVLSGFLNARGKAVLAASLSRPSWLSLLGGGSGSGSGQLPFTAEDAAAILFGDGVGKKRLRRLKRQLRRGLATDDAGFSLDDEANADSSGNDQSRRRRIRRRRAKETNLADKPAGVSEAEGQEASDAADDASDAMDSSVDLRPSVAPVRSYSSPATAGVAEAEASNAGESESEESEDSAVVADGSEASSGVAEADASAEEEASAEAGIVDASAEPADGGEASSGVAESAEGTDAVDVDCIDDHPTGLGGLGGGDDYEVDSEDGSSYAESTCYDDSSDLWVSGLWGDGSRSSAETALNSESADVCCSNDETSLYSSGWDSGVSSGANGSVSSYQLNVQMGASDALGQAMNSPCMIDVPMHGGSSPHSDVPEETPVLV